MSSQLLLRISAAVLLRTKYGRGLFKIVPASWAGLSLGHLETGYILFC